MAVVDEEGFRDAVRRVTGDFDPEGAVQCGVRVGKNGRREYVVRVPEDIARRVGVISSISADDPNKVVELLQPPRRGD